MTDNKKPIILSKEEQKKKEQDEEIEKLRKINLAKFFEKGMNIITSPYKFAILLVIYAGILYVLRYLGAFNAISGWFSGFWIEGMIALILSILTFAIFGLILCALSVFIIITLYSLIKEHDAWTNGTKR